MRKFSKLFSGISGLVLAALAFGAGAAALNHVESFEPAKADGATEAGQFRIKDIGTFNPNWDSGNEWIWLWVEGVNGTTLDYPDVDGTPMVAVDEEVHIPGIGGYGNFTVDGVARNVHSGQTYINMFTRHQLYAFMPEGAGTANTVEFKAGFRIPTLSYVQGGAASYYTLAQDTFGHRQIEPHSIEAVDHWSIGNVAIDDDLVFSSLEYEFNSSAYYNDLSLTFTLGHDFLGNVAYTNGGVFDPADVTEGNPLGVAKEVFLNDHYGQFRRKEAQPEGGDIYTHIEKGIVIGDKTLEEWRDLDVAEADCYGGRWPVSGGPSNKIYRPMIVKFIRDGNSLNSPQIMQLFIHRNYLSWMDATITLKAKYFYAYNPTDGVYYGLAHDIVFSPDFDLDGSQPDFFYHHVKYSKNVQYETFDESFLLGNSEFIDNHNDNKSYKVNVYTDIPIKASSYTQTWCLDHCEYLLDSILVNGVRASVINGMQTRDGHQVYGDDFDAGAPAASNNYARSVLLELKKHGTDNGLIRLSIYVSKAALAAYTPDSTLKSVTIAKNFAWINADNKVSKLVNDKTLYLIEGTGKLAEQEAKEYTFTNAQLVEANTGVGYIYLFTNDETRWGYNLSDKTPYMYNLEHIFINGKSISQINSEFADKIAIADYALSPFDAYGYTDGVPTSSKLTKPVITYSGHDGGTDKDCVQIILHPKYFSYLAGAKITVKYESGIACLSDSYVPYKHVGEDYVATVRDGLDVASPDDFPSESLLRNLATYKANGASGTAIKGLDQTPETLLCRKDTDGNPGYLFTKTGSTATKSEFRFYLGSNDYYAENYGHAVRSVTFNYMITNTGTGTGTEVGASLTPTGEYFDKDADPTKTYMLQFVSRDRTNYYCFDLDLVDDGQLHTYTLNIAFADVTGFNFCIFGFQGSFLISNLTAEYDAYFEGLNNLVHDSLKMYSYHSANGSCATYYADAKAAYLALSSSEKTIFNENASYASAKARLAAWAAANGETFDAAAGTFTPNGAGALFGIVSKSNATIIIIVASALTMISALGIVLVIRRRRLVK